MDKKTTGIIILSCVTILCTLITIGLGIFQTILLFNHVHATQLMWIVYFVQIPFTFMIYGVAGVIKYVIGKD